MGALGQQAQHVFCTDDRKQVRLGVAVDGRAVCVPPDEYVDGVDLGYVLAFCLGVDALRVVDVP